jgi:nucleoside-diphosphate-sugar epimerase
VPTAFVTGGSGFIGGALIRRLAGEGWSLKALARSESSEQKVREAGAEPVPGDIEDPGAMRVGAEGCEYAFHAAAKVEDWGPREEFDRLNAQGTRNTLHACEKAGVRRFVHVGTEAALLAGQPLVNANEDAPLRPDSPAPYSSSKAKAEQAVRDANRDGAFETVVVRPRFVWGRGDQAVLPSILQTIKSGQFRWIGGGRHRTSTTHVDNTVEGLVLGATKGRPGGVYFVTDGDPVVFRDFVTDLVRTQGVEPPNGELPAPVARAAAATVETAWRILPLKSRPPVTRFAVWVASLECTIDISRARSELGYAPVKTIEEGLDELRAQAAG